MTGISRVLHIVAAETAAVHVRSQSELEEDHLLRVDSLSESDLARVRLKGLC